MNIIKKLRLKIGVTQYEFAEIVGTYQHTVSKWENEEVIPSYKFAEILIKLGKKYGVRVSHKILGRSW